MLHKSPYRNRYLFAIIFSALLVIASVFTVLDVFIFESEGIPVPTGSVSPVPTPTVTPGAVATPTPTPFEPISNDMEYLDENIHVKITKVEKEKLVYYVADIQLSDVSYFKTAFAKDKFGRNLHEATSTQANNNNAIIAINGDYYGYRSTGLTIRNGVLYRDNQNGESLVVMNNGDFRIVDGSVSGTTLMAEGALHSFSFGPALVIDGQYVERQSSVARANPRTGVGQVGPLHYLFIVVDGRSTLSSGLTMEEFGKLFEEYGCSVAYNLDGGGTSTMVMNGKVVNKPCYGDERKISDIIYIGK